MTAVLPTTAARTAAMQAHEKQPCTALELDADVCTLTYGSAPCTASGSAGAECYNTFATCQDKANYARGTQTLKFISRGATIPPGELLRPYIQKESGAPTIIDPEAGLSRRAVMKLTLADEPDSDVETDPYIATRAVAAGGTFWGRFLRRNPNIVGRFARVRRGFVVSPWDWDTFLDELYIVESIAGPDASGSITLTLKDPLKLTDRQMVPPATDGKLQADLAAVVDSGWVAGAASTTCVLRTDASAEDDAYTGMELYITGSTGNGQRRTITDYVGATRTCTVAAWGVVPDTSSSYEVGALSIDVGTGKGAQYPDPTTSGKPEYVRIGEEIIRYTAKSGDVLSWSDTSYRAQFGTVRDDAKADDQVQLCRAFVAQPVATVINDLLNESGISDTYIDTAQLASEEGTYLGAQWHITACLSKPEQVSQYLAEICQQTSSVMWWSAQTQEVEWKVLLPRLGSPTELNDAANFVEDSVAVDTLDALRLTRASIYFEQKDATTNLTEAKNFYAGELFVDTDAESADEYGDSRPEVIYSRWFTAANRVAMHSLVARRLIHRRDAPKKVSFKLDPKDYTLPVGDQVDLVTRRMVDAAGQPETVRALITKVLDRGGQIDLEARTTTTNKRYAFIAPNTAGTYPADSDYAHMADGSALMGDGSGAYLTV